MFGTVKSGALIDWHALIGHTGKKGCYATFMKANPIIMIALAGLGQGDEPSEEVLRGCGEFSCSLFCPGGVHIG